jgi:hypothetical protein
VIVITEFIFFFFSWEDVTESTPMTVHVDDEDGVVVTADITNNYNNGTQQPQQQQQHNHHQQDPVGNGRPTGNGLSKTVRVEDESGSVQVSISLTFYE